MPLRLVDADNDILRFRYVSSRRVEDVGAGVDSEKRRTAERDRCAIEASIRLTEKDAVVPCVVVDLTEQGAGLALDEAADLPPRFRLALPLTDELLDERLVELRWRRGGAAGVEFVRS